MGERRGEGRGEVWLGGVVLRAPWLKTIGKFEYLLRKFENHRKTIWIIGKPVFLIKMIV